MLKIKGITVNKISKNIAGERIKSVFQAGIFLSKTVDEIVFLPCDCFLIKNCCAKSLVFKKFFNRIFSLQLHIQAFQKLSYQKREVY